MLKHSEEGKQVKAKNILITTTIMAISIIIIMINTIIIKTTVTKINIKATIINRNQIFIIKVTQTTVTMRSLRNQIEIEKRRARTRIRIGKNTREKRIIKKMNLTMSVSTKDIRSHQKTPKIKRIIITRVRQTNMMMIQIVMDREIRNLIRIKTTFKIRKMIIEA